MHLTYHDALPGEGPRDRPEIEIAMIEAGAAALAGCSSDYYDPEDVAAVIYRAMEAARRLAPP
jgi:hypothetical protein